MGILTLYLGEAREHVGPMCLFSERAISDTLGRACF